jgi:nucleotide-binding universal stress UspA family protein
MFTNVIAGVDGYDGGRDAVSLAKTLCAGRLTLVNAYPADPVRSRASLAGYEELQHDDSQRMLEAARLEADLDAELVTVADMSPAHALQHAAQERDADLIVVGSAHHGPLGRIFLGDVGRVVLHGAPCPVAVAPKRFRNGPPRTIAVGFDGSAQARAALDVGVRLAHELRAALTLYVVWDAPPMPIAAAAAGVGELDRTLEASRGHANQLLADTLAELPISVAGHILRGVPRVELGEVARDVDLLIVGSRAWGPLSRVALGSTSDWLVHHAQCPVLVVPRPSHVPDEPPVGSATASVAG